MASDGELPNDRAARVGQHLQRCWSCRSRKQEIEGAVADFVRFYHDGLGLHLPPAAGPRALLRAQLAALGSVHAPWWTRWLQFFARRPVAIGTLCAMFLITGMAYVVSRVESLSVSRTVPLSLPEPRLTPGAIVILSREELCASNLPKDRSVPASVRNAVFAEYGIPGTDPKAYALDYLISPALGGSDDIRNLWPQFYSAARVKDALEDRLHELVCAGKLDLPGAQRAIASNWIVAYMTYFQTDRPLEQER